MQTPEILTAAQFAPSAPVPLRVLLVGNKEEDFFLIREIMERDGKSLTAELDHAHSLDEARSMLRLTSYGLILFEYETQDDGAVHTLSEFLETEVSVPFILLTENADEKTVAKLIGAGVGECVEKSDLNGMNLMRSIRSTLALYSAQRGKECSEESLRKLSRAVEQSADAVMITNRDGLIEYVNPAFESLTGFSYEEAQGNTPRILKSGEQSPSVYQDMWQTILAGKSYCSILVNRRKNGELYYVEASISPVRDISGAITHFISNARDLTGRMRLEAQLSQAQKMDAIGRLAGGVAHDFNNLLTIITSYSELALDSVVRGSPLENKLQEILSAARRAAQLTRQLLAFSRKQPQALRVLELNPVIEDIAKTLHRLIGEDIELNFISGNGLGRVRADPVQLEQILMNLAANARDAMPQGGHLTIETSDVRLDDEYVHRKHAVIPQGHYALITVTDDGCGIPQENLRYIFEPFYTTKAAGKGTGLGLATVYGIVKQNKGFVWAYSEAGHGTIFKIYLPCVVDHLHPLESSRPHLGAAVQGSETILLVEDEEAVRRATSEFLKLQGYSVIEAKDGVDAVEIARNYDSPIDLVVTDVVMPNMSGGQLAKEMEKIRPETKVLFVSGYAGKTVIDHRVTDLETNFLQKPFTLGQFSAKIREALQPKSVPQPQVSLETAEVLGSYRGPQL
jgi:two-component system cell cycle sensor histidine kinase/response regulator CckA